MKKITFLLIFISVNAFAQTTFKKGYFITKDNQKNEVYFKAFGEEIPDKIVYKDSLGSDIFMSTLTSNIIELVIPNTSKFLRKKISVELLKKGMKSKNNSKKFILEEKELLLKVLLETNTIKVLSYLDQENNRYIFIEDKNVLKFLEYKIINFENKKLIIKSYKNYLLKNNEIISSKQKIDFGKLKYTEKDMVDYFTKYAESNSDSIKVYKGHFRKLTDILNITPKIGYSTFNHKTINENSSYNTDFIESQLNVGLDFEYFFNTDIKKSSILFSIQYHLDTKNEGDFAFGTRSPINTKTYHDFSTYNLDLKYRHYFKLKQHHYLFLNLGFGYQKTNGTTDYIFNENNIKIADLDFNNDDNDLYFSLGAGYNFKNLFLGFDFTPKIKGNYDAINPTATSGDWTYERSLLNISIGYSIF